MCNAGSRHTQSIFHGLRIGSAMLNLYKFKLGFIESPQCEHCPNKIESVKHYFLECYKFTQERDKLIKGFKNTLNTQRQITKNDLLLADNTTENFDKNKLKLLRQYVFTYISNTQRFCNVA